MNTRKDRVAAELAQSHFFIDASVQRIFRLVVPDRAAEDCEQEPIKLLEVNENTVPAGIVPVYFGPHAGSGVYYPSIIIQLTPEEFEQIERSELALPSQWRFGDEYRPDRTSEVMSG